MKRLLSLTALSLIACTFALPGAWAQAYPVKPVRVIIPWPPGGSNDVVGRLVMQKLAQSLGQQFVVDNRAGAAGSIGAELVAKAPPDGYTLMVHSTTHVGNGTLYKNLPYDVVKDFSGVGLLSAQPGVLTVHPSLPVKSVREFIALAKQKPGAMSYASSGNGSGPHLGFELFKSVANIDLVHVPYKGAGPANTDLVGGQVQAFFNNILAAKALIDSGRLRVLASTAAKRSKAMPDLPTLAESGLPGFDVTGWYALLAPAGTPPAILDKAQADAAAVLQVRDVADRLSSEGAEPVGSTSAELARFLQAETRKWAGVVKSAGIKLNE